MNPPRKTSPAPVVSSGSMAEGNAASDSTYRHCVRLTNYSNPYDEVLQLVQTGSAPSLEAAMAVGFNDA